MSRRLSKAITPVTAKIVVACISLLLLLTLVLVTCARPETTPSPAVAPTPPPTLSPAPASSPTPLPTLSPTPSPTPALLTPAPSPLARIKAKWIKAEIAGNTAAITVSEVRNNRISHFAVGTSAGDISFMAYELENGIHVRADICPPCRSDSFSLKKDTLICDVCGTVFDARTGKGIAGGCVSFPKAAVPYEIRDGKMVMQDKDLVTAYLETLRFRP